VFTKNNAGIFVMSLVMDSPPRAGDTTRDAGSPEQRTSSGLDFALQSFVVEARSAQTEMIGAKPMSSADMQKQIDAATFNIYAPTQKNNMQLAQNELSDKEKAAKDMRFDDIFGDEQLGQGYLN
jgi:hypothetical protein